MIAVNLTNLKLDLFARHILTRVDWAIHDDRCVGLIGANGAGKSSLLKLIAGELTPDGGSITRAKGLTIGYLQQEPVLDPAKTALEEALSALAALHQTEAELQALETRLSDPSVYHNEKRLARALEAQQRLLERYAELGGADYEKRVRETLRRLGLNEADFGTLTLNLSGGQKKGDSPRWLTALAASPQNAWAELSTWISSALSRPSPHFFLSCLSLIMSDSIFPFRSPKVSF